MRPFLSALIIAVIFVDCIGLNRRLGTNYQQLTDADLQTTRQLATAFTTSLIQTSDFGPLIRDHFAKDFIQRYTKAKSENLRVATDLYFMPGLEYNSRLLSEAGPEDWLRFYTAASNFVFLGTMSGIKKSRDAADVAASDLYPTTVINLLNTNPILSNMIVRKGKSKAVASVAEMQQVTSILEQAVSLMRQRNKGQASVNVNEQELIKAMREDEFFRPNVETVEDEFFGLPRGTQVVFINTPILFRLMLVKANKDRWEILWAEPYTGG